MDIMNKKKLKNLKYKYIFVVKVNRFGWARVIKKPTKFSRAITINWGKDYDV